MADDTNISPSGNTDITDTTSPDSTPSTGGSDSTPATDTPPQTVAQPQQMSSMDGGTPNVGNPASPQVTPQTDVSKGDPNRPTFGGGGNPAATGAQPHPLVQKANILRQTAQALAGGPRYTESVDVNTGKMTRTQVPMSKSDIGMAIAMEAISGALSGLGQTGPAATGKAAAAGAQTVMGQQQQAQQEQDQQANADYARHAQVFESNLRMLQLAQTMGQKDFESNQQFAAQYKPLADMTQKEHPEAILGIGGEGDAAKYHATKNSALPTGNVIPVLDPKTGKQSVGPAGNKLWQQEYMYIDPNFKGDNFLSPDDVKIGQKYGIIPNGNLPSSLPMRMSMALNYKGRIATMNLADQDVQDFYKREGQDAPDLADMVKKDRTLTDALEKFQPLLAATGNDYGKAIGELASGGQGRTADANAAGKILNLYGGTKMVQKFDNDQANVKEQQKKVADKKAAYDGPLNTQTAESIVADKTATPEQQQRASEFLKTDSKREIGLAANKAYTEAASRTQGEFDTKTKNGVPTGASANSSMIDYFDQDPDVRATIKPENVGPDGINHQFMQAFSQKNPQLGSLIDQIVRGHNLTGRYGLAKKDGQLLDAAVAAATGGQYDKNQAESYNKTVTDFRPGGNMGKAMQNASTAFDHLANLNDSVDSFTSGAVPGAKTLGDWLESDKAGSFATSIANAPQELGSLYANGGAAHENDVKSYRDAYKGPPAKVKSAVRQQAINAMDKVEEVAGAYYASVPKTFDKPQTFLSTKAANNYTRITGRAVDPKLVSWKAPAGAPAPPQGTTNGTPLYQHGQIVAKAQDGQWIWP